MTNIIFYTQPDCPPCEITKAFLKEYGFSFELKDIKADSIARNELINVHKSYSTPTLVIGEHVITGFNLEKLKKVLQIKD
jgi:glutaredoxin